MQYRLAAPGYGQNTLDYRSMHHQRVREASCQIPAAVQHNFQRNGLEWLLGYTYRGSGAIHVRDDLNEEMSQEVFIHESIHTNCEYETRALTEWILGTLRNTCKQPYLLDQDDCHKKRHAGVDPTHNNSDSDATTNSQGTAESTTAQPSANPTIYGSI